MKKTPCAQSISPCEGCHRMCNYTQCRDYRLWLNRCWNRYRRWQMLRYPSEKKEKKNVWRYDSPVLIREFVEKGPCARCAFGKYCKDTESCAAYDAWVSLRWKLLRQKLGVSSN